MIRTIKKLTAPIQRNVQLMIGRAVITLIDDTTKLQTAQVSLLSGEMRDGVEIFRHYGFTSVPHGEAEGVMVSVNGNRDHGILIAIDDRRYRLTGLQSGEVALYTDEGDSIELRRSNNVVINTKTLTVNATTEVIFNTPKLQVNNGDIFADATGLKDHHHGNVQNGGGITSAAEA